MMPSPKSDCERTDLEIIGSESDARQRVREATKSLMILRPHKSLAFMAIETAPLPKISYHFVSLPVFDFLESGEAFPVSVFWFPRSRPLLPVERWPSR